MKPTRLILASSSPRRQELIRLLGLSVPIDIQSSDADETVPSDWAPDRIVEQLALRKARAVRSLQMHGSAAAVILGADTIVVQDGQVLGKPQDAADAIGMLERLQGRSHDVFSGIALVDTNGRELAMHAVTRVYMKSLDPARIERYVASGEPLDKAGAYGIQGAAAAFVERIDGCYFNVVGLPVSLAADMLQQFGMDTV
jgi:septum formation protein